MTLKRAEAVARLLGGTVWQSGENCWLVIQERADGKVVVISDDLICVYANKEAIITDEPEFGIEIGREQMNMDMADILRCSALDICRKTYGMSPEDAEIDDKCGIAPGEGGDFVQVWIWVPHKEYDDAEEE